MKKRILPSPRQTQEGMLFMFKKLDIVVTVFYIPFKLKELFSRDTIFAPNVFSFQNTLHQSKSVPCECYQQSLFNSVWKQNHLRWIVSSVHYILLGGHFKCFACVIPVPSFRASYTLQFACVNRCKQIVLKNYTPVLVKDETKQIYAERIYFQNSLQRFVIPQQP